MTGHLTERELDVLRTTAVGGATEERLSRERVDVAAFDSVIRQGFARIDRIVLRETQPPGRAHQAPQEIRTYYLTPSGAEAIGENPRLIGAR